MPSLFSSIHISPIIFFVCLASPVLWSMFISAGLKNFIVWEIAFVSISPISSWVTLALFVILVSAFNDLATTFTFTIAEPSLAKFIKVSTLPSSVFTVELVLIVPSLYITWRFLNCTPSGKKSFIFMSFISLFDKFSILSVYVKFSADDIIVSSGILHVWVAFIPALFIPITLSSRLSTLVSSPWIVALIVISLWYMPSGNLLATVLILKTLPPTPLSVPSLIVIIFLFSTTETESVTSTSLPSL